MTTDNCIMFLEMPESRAWFGTRYCMVSSYFDSENIELLQDMLYDNRLLSDAVKEAAEYWGIWDEGKPPHELRRQMQRIKRMMEG